MQENIGKKLRALFDFQRFEEEPGLQKVISDTVNSSSNIKRLSDDELEYAAGGVGVQNPKDEKPLLIGRAYCKKCDKVMDVEIYSGGRGICTKCRSEIDNI